MKLTSTWRSNDQAFADEERNRLQDEYDRQAREYEAEYMSLSDEPEHERELPKPEPQPVAPEIEAEVAKVEQTFEREYDAERQTRRTTITLPSEVTLMRAELFRNAPKSRGETKRRTPDSYNVKLTVWSGPLHNIDTREPHHTLYFPLSEARKTKYRLSLLEPTPEVQTVLTELALLNERGAYRIGFVTGRGQASAVVNHKLRVFVQMDAGAGRACEIQGIAEGERNFQMTPAPVDPRIRHPLAPVAISYYDPDGRHNAHRKGR